MTPTIVKENENVVINGTITSGKNLSYWTQSVQPILYKKLDHNAEADVLIIGGGISGLTTAYCLCKSGYKVILVEDGFIGSGESGRTTAHLTCALDDRYYDIENILGKEKAILAANSHMAAIEWIDNTIQYEKIDCDLKRVDGYLFLSGSDKKENLIKEYEATKRVGLITEMLPQVPHIDAEEGEACIKFTRQGQFHIMKYLKGLAEAVTDMGGNIYTETKAGNITSAGAEANGFTIQAKHIVVATNTPVNDWVTMHTKQWPYRSYVIGAKVPRGTYPYALWWDTGDMNSRWISKPYHYARLEEFDEVYDLLICGGEDHKTGQADDEHIAEEDRYEKLIDWTGKRFPAMGEIQYHWSGQVIEPIDSLAFIGRNPGDENIYIVTGDSGNGMTHGTLGGLIITDLIAGKENPWEDLYSPSRINLNTMADYLVQVGNMVAQFADWFTPGDVDRLSQVKAGEGAVLTDGLKKMTAFRDQHNQLHLCSAVCPHLGGILQWNADEQSFDCPLHGSRFTPDGKVMNGPSKSDLKKIDPPPVN